MTNIFKKVTLIEGLGNRKKGPSPVHTDRRIEEPHHTPLKSVEGTRDEHVQLEGG